MQSSSSLLAVLLPAAFRVARSLNEAPCTVLNQTLIATAWRVCVILSLFMAKLTDIKYISEWQVVGPRGFPKWPLAAKARFRPRDLFTSLRKKIGIPGAARLSCVFSYHCLRSINVWPQSTPLILLYKPRLEVTPFLSSKSTRLQILMLLVWQSAQSFSHLAVSVLQDRQSQPKWTRGRRAPEQGTEACDGLLCLTSTHTTQSNPLHLGHPAGPGSIPHLSSNLAEIFLCQALC